MLDFIFTIIILYFLCGIGAYAHAVIHTHQIMDEWDFRIREHLIGIIPYPKWLLWWAYKLAVSFKWN